MSTLKKEASYDQNIFIVADCFSSTAFTIGQYWQSYDDVHCNVSGCTTTWLNTMTVIPPVIHENMSRVMPNKHVMRKQKRDIVQPILDIAQIKTQR